MLTEECKTVSLKKNELLAFFFLPIPLFGRRRVGESGQKERPPSFPPGQGVKGQWISVSEEVWAGVREEMPTLTINQLF